MCDSSISNLFLFLFTKNFILGFQEFKNPVSKNPSFRLDLNCFCIFLDNSCLEVYSSALCFSSICLSIPPLPGWWRMWRLSRTHSPILCGLHTAGQRGCVSQGSRPSLLTQLCCYQVFASLDPGKGCISPFSPQRPDRAFPQHIIMDSSTDTITSSPLQPVAPQPVSLGITG